MSESTGNGRLTAFLTLRGGWGGLGGMSVNPETLRNISNVTGGGNSPLSTRPTRSQ